MARALLGCRLWARRPGGAVEARIVETEAYEPSDPASHSFRGPTDRNRAMFGPAGRWYVYRIHQVYCANVTTGHGAAVLLRAAEARSRGMDSLSGPGRLARALGIDRRLDGRSVRSGPVRILAGETPTEPVVRGPRVGISRATERPWRFALAGVRAVSSPRPATP